MVEPGDKDGKDGDKGDAGGEELKQLQATLSSVKEELDGLKTAKEEAETKLEDAEGALLAPEYLDFKKNKGKGTQTPPGSEGEVNLEEMTPVEISKYFANATKGELTESIKELTEKMKTMGEDMRGAFAQVDFMITANKHKELDDAAKTPAEKRTPEQKELMKELWAISKENPKWNTERCLRMAKANIKIKVDEVAEAEAQKAKEEKQMITEKPGQSSAVVKEKTLNKEQSASKAWDAVMGSKKSLD